MPFPYCSRQWLLTTAAYGGLLPAPASRERGTYPHLLPYLSSHPGELPSQVLTDPYMSLSTHTALVIQPLPFRAVTNAQKDRGSAWRSFSAASDSALYGPYTA